MTKFLFSREQAIRILDIAIDQDDPHWERSVDDYYDEKNDELPTIYDVMAALGVSKDEYDKAIMEPTP